MIVYDYVVSMIGKNQPQSNRVRLARRIYDYGRRWRRLTGRIWKQRKGLELDAAMNDRVPITSFCRKLRKMGVKPWRR